MDQDDRHDWFGDLAESYVSYLAAREGLEVFGAGKWTADVAIHERDSRQLFRVEVRATDRSRRPNPKPAYKLARTAEVIAEVTMPSESRLQASFWKLDSRGHKVARTRLDNPAPGQLRTWLLERPGTTAAAPVTKPPAETDPLLALSGAFESELTDIGERHDEYIGQALAAEMRGEPDA
jgi:hypothetical protein